jgi:hypothetical protein
MMKRKKNTVSVSEINELLRNYLNEVEDAARRHGGGAINYPYATGVLTSALRHLVTLATTGGTPEEVRNALKYETALTSQVSR